MSRIFSMTDSGGYQSNVLWRARFSFICLLTWVSINTNVSLFSRNLFTLYYYSVFAQFITVWMRINRFELNYMLRHNASFSCRMHTQIVHSLYAVCFVENVHISNYYGSIPHTLQLRLVITKVCKNPEGVSIVLLSL